MLEHQTTAIPSSLFVAPKQVNLWLIQLSQPTEPLSQILSGSLQHPLNVILPLKIPGCARNSAVIRILETQEDLFHPVDLPLEFFKVIVPNSKQIVSESQSLKFSNRLRN